MNNFKPESSDNIYKQEKFLVICPLKSNDIFDRQKYEVKILPPDDEEYRIVLLRKKPPE